MTTTNGLKNPPMSSNTSPSILRDNMSLKRTISAHDWYTTDEKSQNCVRIAEYHTEIEYTVFTKESHTSHRDSLDTRHSTKIKFANDKINFSHSFVDNTRGRRRNVLPDPVTERSSYAGDTSTNQRDFVAEHDAFKRKFNTKSNTDDAKMNWWDYILKYISSNKIRHIKRE